MKIASFNVNGIRACVNKGFIDWYKKTKADIVCLQEIKALEEQFPDELMKLKRHFYINSAEKKGYSGTCIISKTEPIKITNLGKKEFDSEGRTQIAEYEDIIIFNCYFPNGQRDYARIPYKMKFNDSVMKKALKLHKITGKEVVITGDFNVAHHEIDLANPKTNTKSVGFLPIERDWMTKFLNKGFVDIFRELTPEENGHYTWWTYRGDCRERNIGWRLDYFCSTPGLLKRVKKCTHLTEVLGSDHCPILLEIK